MLLIPFTHGDYLFLNYIEKVQKIIETTKRFSIFIQRNYIFIRFKG